MDKLTIIIPLHVYDDEVKAYLAKALDSVKNFKADDEVALSFVGPQSVMKSVKVDVGGYKLGIDTEYYNNDGTTDVFSQVNLATKYCLTDYFTVLEFDDTFNPYWLCEFKNYEKDNSDASVYLPIVELHSVEDNEFKGFVNEIAWATSFSSEELGYLDLECLKSFMDFNVTGGIIKTVDFVSIGGLKPSLKIAAWYEFLLRVAKNGKNIYVVPMAGYNHIVGRDNSYMKVSHDEIDSNYGRWLIDQAQIEYEFNEEREITYNPQGE